jgi:hypothetical protein
VAAMYPDNPSPLYKKGVVLYHMKKTREAFECFKSLDKLKGNGVDQFLPIAYTMMAEISYFDHKSDKEALNFIDKALTLKIDPTVETMCYTLKGKMYLITVYYCITN